MGTEIQTVKNQMTLKNWVEEVAECQSSGMTVSAWCELHGINVKTYYYHLRRVRESLLTESHVVPLSTKNISDNIEIFSGDVRITLPFGCSEETLSTVLKVLKNAQ
ncbi:MAG: IS66 family insertion sequence element accessory protein TnpB [Oscillospiraceae bacterium]|nr:IS66 family insertion sequence element accessory protein TnpB [Oscillospiraceae bacterium]